MLMVNGIAKYPLRVNRKVVAPGQSFEIEEKAADRLKKAGLIETAAIKPAENAMVDYQAMTKNDLVKILVKKKKEFNKRQTKQELIDLLAGD